MKLDKPTLAWIAAVGLCATFATIYMVWRVRIHTFDALSYAWNVRDKPFGLLFHPHHLLYAPVGRVAYLLATRLGYTGFADAPIQLVNALAGAFGVGLFWRFGARWRQREGVALAVAALIGVSYAYWLYASEVEVYTLATMFLILCMLLLLRLSERPSPGTAALLGLAHTGAIMFHQTNALFAVPIVAFLLMTPSTRPWRIIVTYAMVGSLSTLGIYGLVGLASDFTSFKAFFDWFMGYTQSGIWGGYLSAEHLPALRAGWQVTVSQQAWLALIFYGCGLAGIVMMALRDKLSPWMVFGLTWLVVYTLFFWWWEPWNIEFWIATLPLWGLFILGAFPQERSKDGFSVWQAYGIGLSVLVVLLFNANVDAIRETTRLDEEYYFRMTKALEGELTPNDLVVTRGNVLDIYLPFYAEHSGVLSMREVTQNSGGDRGRIMGEVISRLDWAYNTGQVVIMDGFLLDQPLEASQNAFGFTSEEIDALRSRYPWAETIPLDGQPVYYHFPRYDDPTRTAWQFETHADGWRAYGVDAPRYDGGWCFTGGIDPQLSSVPLSFDGDRYDQLQLDITVEGGPAEAEIFWRTPERDYSLDRSESVQLSEGRQTVSVGMAWSGEITQLRIDPYPGDTEVTACLHAVELLD